MTGSFTDLTHRFAADPLGREKTGGCPGFCSRVPGPAQLSWKHAAAKSRQESDEGPWQLRPGAQSQLPQRGSIIEYHGRLSWDLGKLNWIRRIPSQGVELGRLGEQGSVRELDLKRLLN